jgi:hypothetical protein
MDSFFPVREAPLRSDTEKLHDYLIDRNPEGVKKVLMLNGYRQITTPDQMREALLRLAAKGGEEAVYQLIEEHPDYDLIVAGYERKHETSDSSPVVAASEPIKQVLSSFSIDFEKVLTVFLFLVLAWLALKILKD